jgi:hypothetical protein
MGSHVVRVWDKPYTVTTDKLSKSVWRASGEHMGESHSTQDRTQGAAVKRWREWAQYKGNG